MTKNRRAGRTALRAGLAGCVAILLAGCMADQEAASEASGTDTIAAQPRMATYDCGEDGAITVENLSSMVRLVEAAGDSYQLPASPPTQTSRFGEGGYALVVEGQEALWMKAGSEPMTCRR